MIASLSANAEAETRWSAGNGPALSASSQLKLKVIVPKILILRIGHTGSAIDQVWWTAVPNSSINNQSYSSSIPPDSSALPYEVHDTVGANTNNGVISFKLYSNSGTATLRAVATNNALTDGSNSIPIVPDTTITASPSTTNPVIDGSAINFPPNSDGIVYRQSSGWRFTYHPDTVSPPPAAGTYSTVITYTASIP